MRVSIVCSSSRPPIRKTDGRRFISLPAQHRRSKRDFCHECRWGQMSCEYQRGCQGGAGGFDTAMPRDQSPVIVDKTSGPDCEGLTVRHFRTAPLGHQVPSCPCEDCRRPENYQPLSDQRAVPDAQQQLLELIEVPRTECGTPFLLDVTENIEDLCISSMAALGKPHNSRTALCR